MCSFRGGFSCHVRFISSAVCTLLLRAKSVVIHRSRHLAELRVGGASRPVPCLLQWICILEIQLDSLCFTFGIQLNHGSELMRKKHIFTSAMLDALLNKAEYDFPHWWTWYAVFSAGRQPVGCYSLCVDFLLPSSSSSSCQVAELKPGREGGSSWRTTASTTSNIQQWVSWCSSVLVMCFCESISAL